MVDPNLITALSDPSFATLSDADALTQLQQDKRTVSAIVLAQIVPWLNSNGIVARLRRTLASATFTAVCNALQLPLPATSDSVSDALDYFYSPSNTYIETNTAPYAAQTVSLLQLMQAINAQDATLGLTAAEATTFLGFGGGPRTNPAWQVSDVTAARAQMTFDAQVQSLLALAAKQYNATFAWMETITPQTSPQPQASDVLTYLGTQH